MDRENITVEELYNIAISAIAEVKSEDVFLVQDLFRDIDWRHISIEKRLRLGSLILKYSESEGFNVIRIIGGADGKTSEGQQRYIKI